MCGLLNQVVCKVYIKEAILLPQIDHFQIDFWGVGLSRFVFLNLSSQNNSQKRLEHDSLLHGWESLT